MSTDIIRYYADRSNEASRLSRGADRFEYLRTRIILTRYLTQAPMRILDAGGGPGAYAFWLASLGHQVSLLDLVPRHVEIARERMASEGIALADLRVGDATALPYGDDSFDMVLLMGPLYHLQDRDLRLKAIREAARVARPGAPVFCAAISRFASMLDGFLSKLFDDPVFRDIVDEDLRTGCHQNISAIRNYFTTSYLHLPGELAHEVRDAGLACQRLLAVEGPLLLSPALNDWLDEQGEYLQLALKYTEHIEAEPSLLGASGHLLAIGVK